MAPVIIILSVFFLGSAAVHIEGMIAQGNFSPYNVFMIWPGILVPVFIVALALLSSRKRVAVEAKSSAL